MANRAHGRRPVRAVPVQTVPGPRSEPPVRRWPHPVDGAEVLPEPCAEDQELRYIHCALAYQNQLLADIKALLETAVQNTAPSPKPAEAKAERGAETV